LGREGELARLSDLMSPRDGSVVTLVGPGGAGKTRLALELCVRATVDGDGEVHFVDLRETRDTSAVVSALAATLELAEEPGHDPLERVASTLRHGSRLLVLDNMEQVVEAGSTVADLASSCPQVAVVVTSRRRLNVRSERVLVVRPLELSPAIALFCERAAAVSGRDFSGDTATITEICRRLDGLPLAIELAAAYCRLLSPTALLNRLSRGPTDALALLDRAAVDVPEHHQGLRTAMSVSYELLDPDARRLFRSLAVFEGGWTLDAMEAVCEDLPAVRLWDGLVELVDLHLVDPVDTGTREARFRMLDTVRQFAAALLAGAGETAVVERRHAEFFLALALDAGSRLESRDQLAATNEIDQDLANIRASLDWLHQAGRADEALAATAALGPFWREEGLAAEGHRRLDALLAATTADDLTRANADAWSARLAFAPVVLDSVANREVIERLEAARNVLAAGGDRVGHLRASVALGVVSLLVGDFERSVDVTLASLEGYVEDQYAWLRAELLRNLAFARRAQGLLAEGRQLALDAERLAAAVGNVLVVTDARLARLLVEPVASRSTEAEVVFNECVNVRNWQSAALTATVLSGDHAAEGNVAVAARWADRAVELAVRAGNTLWAPFALMVSLFTASAAGRQRDAARISGVLRPAEDLLTRELSPGITSAYRAAVDAARAALGDNFDAEYRAGERLVWLQAVDYVRSMLAEIGTPPTAVATASRPHRRRGPRANPNPTDREIEILRELACGGTNQTIAEILHISPKTVMHHTTSIYRKLGVRGRAEAVATAIRSGLVQTQHAE
jgi:predicted ATPase/DNA-binding CsgD family transcriptional regulator